MRKTILLAMVSFFCFFAFVGTALAIDGMYISGNVGSVMLSDSGTDFAGVVSADISHDTGYAVSLAVGRKVEYVRVEAELAYRTTDIDKLAGVSVGGDVTALSLMANCFFDMNTGTAFTPFLGGGIGVSNIDAKLVIAPYSFSDDVNVFTYQAIAGFSYALSEKMSLDLSYRYLATTEPKFKGDIDSEYKGNNFMLGLRYSF